MANPAINHNNVQVILMGFPALFNKGKLISKGKQM